MNSPSKIQNCPLGEKESSGRGGATTPPPGSGTTSGIADSIKLSLALSAALTTDARSKDGRTSRDDTGQSYVKSSSDHCAFATAFSHSPGGARMYL